MTDCRERPPVRVRFDRRRGAAARRLARPAGAGGQHRLVLRIHPAIPRSRSAVAALSRPRARRARRAVQRFRPAGAGIAAEIKQFCETNYAVDFPLAQKCRVIGGRRPIRSIAGSPTRSARPARRAGTFTNILIGPDGELAGAWPSQVAPADPRHHRARSTSCCRRRADAVAGRPSARLSSAAGRTHTIGDFEGLAAHDPGQPCCPSARAVPEFQGPALVPHRRPRARAYLPSPHLGAPAGSCAYGRHQASAVPAGWTGSVGRRQIGGAGEGSDRQLLALAADFDLLPREAGQVEPGARHDLVRDDQLAANSLVSSSSRLAVLTASPIAVIDVALP